jgi:hypothetical protein
LEEGIPVNVGDLSGGERHGTASEATVTFSGEQVEAMVKEVEVELVDESGKWGSKTLHFRTAEEKAYALAKYVQGEYVELEI